MVYEKHNFIFVLTLICDYVFGLSFLTTLDIYKAYFRSRHIREYKENECKGERMQNVTDALFSQKEATASLRLRVL